MASRGVRSLARALAAGLVVAVVTSPTVALAAPTASPTAPSATPGGTRTTYKTKPTPFALTISPTRLVVGQGGSALQQVQVVNRGEESVSVTVQTRNFAAGVDGSLTYSQDAPYGAADWLAVSPRTFEAKPGATQVVTARVTIPSDPEVGDHQAALIFLVPPGQTDGNIRINRGVGVPVFITVPGPVDDSVALRSVHAPGFAAWGPLTITAQVQNTGTVHRDFRGATALAVQGVSKAAPFPDFTVPRGAVRDLSTTWDPPVACICHPRVEFSNGGVLQSQTVRVVIFPWHLVAIAVGVYLLLVLGLRLIRRQYQNRVLAAAAQLRQPTGSGDV